MNPILCQGEIIVFRNFFVDIRADCGILRGNNARRAARHERAARRLFSEGQIKTPLQWSISCWMIWAVKPVKVRSRV